MPIAAGRGRLKLYSANAVAVEKHHGDPCAEQPLWGYKQLLQMSCGAVVMAAAIYGVNVFGTVIY